MLISALFLFSHRTIKIIYPYFQKSTMKKTKGKEISNIRILIVCICVIMIWKAVWDLCDMFIFPNNIILSDIVCLVVWIVVLLLDDGKLYELM